MALFGWSVFDVRTLLPPAWDEQIVDAARRLQRRKYISPPHVTSREQPDVRRLEIRGVGALSVSAELPWLDELYRTLFRDLAQMTTSEDVTVADGLRHTVVLNVQDASDSRYECHVDTNPIQGLLYATSQPDGSGGELVVSNRPDACGPEAIDADCSLIYPQSGHLVFFDGRNHPHYIRPLIRQNDLRVAVAMNYYVPSWPEERRPVDLDDYLYGSEIT